MNEIIVALITGGVTETKTEELTREVREHNNYSHKEL